MPDFVKIADAYGVKGFRVNTQEELLEALAAAKQEKKVPVLIEIPVEEELDVLPMVPSGKSLDEMILEVTN